MGKYRSKRKSKHHGNDPIGIRDDCENDHSHEIDNGTPSSRDECTVQTIIEQVQGITIEDKICGLQTLATAFNDKESIEILIKKKVFKMVAPLLLDPNPEIRNFTAGALRNLSACGNIEICEHIVKEDVLTPLISLIQQYGDWKPNDTKPDQENENIDTLIQAINLLWNLCESDDTAVKYFNTAQLLGVLLNYLNFNVYGMDLAIVVCQCIHTVSEDNMPATTVLRNFETELLAILRLSESTPKLQQLKILVAGLIINCNSSSNWLVPVLSTVSETLNTDYRVAISQLSSQVPLQQTVLPLDNAIVLKIDDCTALVNAHITALEILTNMCSSQDDEMEQESDDTFSDEMEEGDDGWTDANVTQPLVLSADLHEAIIKFDFLKNIHEDMRPLPENVLDILRNCPETSDLIKKLLKLQCRAFLCYSNIVSVLDVEDLKGADDLYLVFKNIGKILLPQETTIEIDFVEAATSAMRSVLLKLASVRYDKLSDLTVGDIEMLVKLGKESQVIGNIIKIMGTLGVMFANNDNLEMTKIVGSFLMHTVETQSELWLMAEALDAIMDVFAEDSTDLVAFEINLVSKLKLLAPSLKRKLRQERKNQPEHYAIVSTVTMNLGRFINYKGSRLDMLKKGIP